MNTTRPSRQEVAEAVQAQLAAVGIYAMYGGRKGHGFWMSCAKEAGTECDKAIRDGKGFDFMMSEASAGRSTRSGFVSLQNDGKRSGNPWFFMMADAKRLADALTAATPEDATLRIRILAATTRAELDAIAEDMEGLGCVDLEGPADDVTTTVDEARALLLEALES